MTVLLSLSLSLGFVLRPNIWKNNFKKIIQCSCAWYFIYLIFIAFFTGPQDLSKYPPAEASPFLLPWQAGVSRFVSQGNRSFTSHRGVNLIAWDFVMPIGTPVLAARDGIVVQVIVEFDGIGPRSNLIILEHADGIRTGYAHLKKDGSFVKVGEQVVQGQTIGLSGLVGQTIFPHLHFFVTLQDGQTPVPISFKDVPGGVPFAGHFYKSENFLR